MHGELVRRVIGECGFEVGGLFSIAECMGKWMEARGTKGSDIKAKIGEEEGDFSLDSRRKLCQNGESKRRRGWELKKEGESGGRVLDLRKFCVLGEKEKERREEKNKKKRNRGKSEGDGGFERFSFLNMYFKFLYEIISNLKLLKIKHLRNLILIIFMKLIRIITNKNLN